MRAIRYRASSIPSAQCSPPSRSPWWRPLWPPSEQQLSWLSLAQLERNIRISFTFYICSLCLDFKEQVADWLDLSAWLSLYINHGLREIVLIVPFWLLAKPKSLCVRVCNLKVAWISRLWPAVGLAFHTTFWSDFTYTYRRNNLEEQSNTSRLLSCSSYGSKGCLRLWF